MKNFKVEFEAPSQTVKGANRTFTGIVIDTVSTITATQDAQGIVYLNQDCYVIGDPDGAVYIVPPVNIKRIINQVKID